MNYMKIHFKTIVSTKPPFFYNEHMKPSGLVILFDKKCNSYTVYNK